MWAVDPCRLLLFRFGVPLHGRRVVRRQPFALLRGVYVRAGGEQPLDAVDLAGSGDVRKFWDTAHSRTIVAHVFLPASGRHP